MRTDAPWRDLPPEFDEEIGYRDTTAPRETKGFIGERYDADAGLQYLNARYCDPKLALFLQPDWFEVQEPGVGTNRYSYSFNDPMNLSDPSRNATRATDRDGDGENEFFEHFAADSPEHAALTCGCSAGRAHMNAYDAQWGDLLGGLAADGVTSVSFTGTGFEVSVAELERTYS